MEFLTIWKSLLIILSPTGDKEGRWKPEQYPKGNLLSRLHINWALKEIVERLKKSPKEQYRLLFHWSLSLKSLLASNASRYLATFDKASAKRSIYDTMVITVRDKNIPDGIPIKSPSEFPQLQPCIAPKAKRNPNLWLSIIMPKHYQKSPHL
jgi:hypothetical protein